MPSGSPEWPEARTLRLRELWDEGVPVSEIGRQLGVTLNAVVGKSHRLHLTPRASPIQPAGSGRKPYKRTPHLKPQPLPLPPLVSVVAVAALVAETVVVKAEVRRPVPVGVPRHPGRGECQFISGDTRGKWRFCGDPCTQNARGLRSPYCAKHLAACTSGAPALRSEAA